MTLFPAITGTAAIPAEVAAVPVIASRASPSLGVPLTASRIAPAQGIQAPTGTAPCTVGAVLSCHPTPMFSASTPAATNATANASTSANGRASGISSAPVILKMTGKSGPTAARTAPASSTPKRMRPSASPPQESSRRFVAGERNWSTR